MRIIAHRGCPLLHLENTLTSFQKAVDLGYNMIEMDVQQTKDNQLVIFHDDTLERLTPQKIPSRIQDLTWEELKNVELLQGERIPSLLEVLQHLEHRIALNLEIKSEGCGILLADVLNHRKPLHPYLLSSFSKEELGHFNWLNPILQSAFLVDQIDDFAIEFVKTNAIQYLHCSSEGFTLNYLDKLNTLNIQCQVYTINEQDQFEQFSQYPIHGIFTDNHQFIK